MTQNPGFNFDHWKSWIDSDDVPEGQFGPFLTFVDYLQSGSRYRCSTGNRLVQCMFRPSFGHPWVLHEVFEIKKKYWLLRTTCNWLSEVQITFDYCAISESEFRSLMALTEQPLPMFERGETGLDGAFYELAFSGGGLQTVRYSWWSVISDGWKPLSDMFNAFTTYFDSALEQNT